MCESVCVHNMCHVTNGTSPYFVPPSMGQHWLHPGSKEDANDSKYGEANDHSHTMDPHHHTVDLISGGVTSCSSRVHLVLASLGEKTCPVIGKARRGGA